MLHPYICLNINTLSKNELKHFQSQWNHLVKDPYLPQQYGIRFRRHGSFEYNSATGLFIQLPSGSYEQSKEMNPVMGGIERKFQPLDLDKKALNTLKGILNYGTMLFDVKGKWKMHTHMIRIPSHVSLIGWPSPEGVHSDGFEYIAIHLIARKSIKGADTTIYDNNRNKLHQVTLEKPLDSIFAEDDKVMHHTTNFMSDNFGYRDTLLVSWNKVP